MANVSSSNGIEKQPKLRFQNFTEPYKLMEFSKYADVNPKCGKVPNSFYYIDLECVNAGEIKDLRIEMAETAPSRAQRLLTLYDILFQTVRPYQKNNYHFKVENDLPTVASTGYAVFRTEQSSEYLYELIHTERFLSDIMKRCTGTSFPAVSSSDIEDIAIWIPGFQEQKKIGDFLTLVDTKIAKQRLLIEHLKKYKRGVSKRFFDEIHNDQNCEAKQFSEVFELIQNNTFSRECLTDENTDVLNVHYGDILVKYGSVLDPDIDTVPFIKSGTDLSKFSGSSYLQDGDVIFADTAEDYTVGKMCEIINVSNRKILSGLHTMPFRPTITFAPMYLGYYLNSAAFRTQILPMIQGAKVSSISKSEMKNTIIHIPSIERQTEIVGILNALDKRIKRTELILAELKEMKKGLLQNLFI